LATKNEKLAALLLSDRDRPTSPKQHNITLCFVCGHRFVYRGRRGNVPGGGTASLSLNGRFCSIRCQDWYDAGNEPIDEDVVYRSRDGRPMRMGPKGFYIDCGHCHKEFESLGPRCCSVECERSYRERKDNLALMAEAGIEAAPKKICAAPGCRAIIPTWKNGRRVSARVTFCSPKCRVKAHRAQTAFCNDKATEKARE